MFHVLCSYLPVLSVSHQTEKEFLLVLVKLATSVVRLYWNFYEEKLSRAQVIVGNIERGLSHDNPPLQT